MKIGLGKALGFSLLAFIGLNFLFIIIAYTISGDLNLLFSAISSDPLIIIFIFFEPIRYMPGTVITDLYNSISLGMTDVAALIQYIGFIVSPFVAALVAGRTGGGKGGSFGGWMLAALIGATAVAVLFYVQLAAPIGEIIIIMLSGAVNGIFYGCFALLFTKTEMY